MRKLAIAWLTIAGPLSCASVVAQDATWAALDDCIGKIESIQGDDAPGVGAVQKLCPDLQSIVEHSASAAWLPEQWWGPLLTPDSLRELHQLAEDEPHARGSRTLDTAEVGAALASLGAESDDQLSWWERLREWLRSRLQADSGEPGRFYEWMDELARHQTVLRIITYTLFALIVLSVGVIVINELRMAGVFGARWAKAGRPVIRAHAAGSTAALTLEDIERSDPQYRPSLLLSLLLTVLARRQDRAVDRSSTHRELAARISLDDDAQRSAFIRLARCAEHVRYAAASPGPVEIEAAVSGGRRLLEALTAQPRASAA